MVRQVVLFFLSPSYFSVVKSEIFCIVSFSSAHADHKMKFNEHVKPVDMTLLLSSGPILHLHNGDNCICICH